MGMKIAIFTKKKNKWKEVLRMTKKVKDKIAGALYGFAIGDAMGATTEFMSEEQIKRIHGKVNNIIGGGAFNWEPGEVTDDTQMSFCIMDALMSINKKWDFGYNFMVKCRDNFINWKNTNPKDIGNQCLSSLNYIEKNEKLMAKEDADSQGNGSLMRALPCALINTPLLNEAQGVITHHNEVCSKLILKYHVAIQMALAGNYTSDIFWELRKPTGWVVDTYNNSMYWANKDSFEECIIGAVNHGGDSDTIAAIAGGLAGARFGFDAIPKRWVKQLNPDVKEKLDKFLKFVLDYLE